LPKRAPTPVVFDVENMLHLRFIAATACLRATVFKVKIPSDKPRTDAFRKEVGQMALKVTVPDFILDDSAAKEIQASVDKDKEEAAKKDDTGQEEEKEEAKQEEQIGVDEVEKLKKQFAELCKGIEKPKAGQSYEDTVVKAEEFEKDDDSNCHIDFMHAMSNCRAASYELDPMDWLQVKLKAGRIVPAMATTTAAIAGLQALELVKLLRKAKKQDHRNAFLNLAVPIMQASEPGDVQKIKLTDKIETSLWDRWEVNAKGLSLRAVMAKVEELHEGLVVRDVLRGNAPVYFHAIMNAPGKEKEKEATLNTPLATLLGGEAGAGDEEPESYVDLTITCSAKGDPSSTVLEGVPVLRATFA